MITLTLNYTDRAEERVFQRSELREAWQLAKTAYIVAQAGTAFEGLMSITLADRHKKIINLEWTIPRHPKHYM